MKKSIIAYFYLGCMCIALIPVMVYIFWPLAFVYLLPASVFFYLSRDLISAFIKNFKPTVNRQKERILKLINGGEKQTKRMNSTKVTGENVSNKNKDEIQDDFNKKIIKETTDSDMNSSAIITVDVVAEEAKAKRLAKEKAKAERIARDKAEKERIAKEKAEAKRLAEEKAEAERIAKEAERIAKEMAEKERIEKERAEAERLAREKVEAERAAREKAEAEAKRIAEERAEAERIAKERAEAERIAREKAEIERIEKERAEAERIAHEKAEAERIERERAEAERIAREKAEAERIAHERAEAERAANRRAEALQRANAKTEAVALQLSKEQGEALRLASEKAETLQLTKERTDALRSANETAEADALQLANEKTRSLLQAKAESEAAMFASKQADEDVTRLNKEKTDALRHANDKAMALQLVDDKTKAAKLADEEAEALKTASEKAEALRLANEKAETSRIINENAKAEVVRLTSEEEEALLDAKTKTETLQNNNKEAEITIVQLIKEHEEAVKLANEKGEALRIANDRAEALRLAQEEETKVLRIVQQEAEAERVALEQEAEAVRLAQEQEAEAARLVKEQEAEAARIAQEREAEVARLAQEQEAEAARLVKEQEAEAARIIQEREADTARIAQETEVACIIQEREAEAVRVAQEKEQEVEVARIIQEREAEVARIAREQEQESEAARIIQEREAETAARIAREKKAEALRIVQEREAKKLHVATDDEAKSKAEQIAKADARLTELLNKQMMGNDGKSSSFGERARATRTENLSNESKDVFGNVKRGFFNVVNNSRNAISSVNTQKRPESIKREIQDTAITYESPTDNDERWANSGSLDIARLDSVGNVDDVKKQLDNLDMITTSAVAIMLSDTKLKAASPYIGTLKKPDIRLVLLRFLQDSYFATDIEQLNNMLNKSYYKRQINRYLKSITSFIKRGIGDSLPKKAPMGIASKTKNNFIDKVSESIHTFENIKYITALSENEEISESRRSYKLDHLNENYKDAMIYLVDILLTCTCITKMLFVERMIQNMDEQSEFNQIIKNMALSIDNHNHIINRSRPIYKQYYQSELGYINGDDLLYGMAITIMVNRVRKVNEDNIKLLQINKNFSTANEFAQDMHRWLDELARHNAIDNIGTLILQKITLTIQDNYGLLTIALQELTNWENLYKQRVLYYKKASDKERYLMGIFEEEEPEELKVRVRK